MQRSLFNYTVPFFFLATSHSSAFADNLPQVYTKNSERIVRNSPQLPLVLQVGLDAGLLSHQTTIPREGPFVGSMIAGKSIGSLLFENWILEAGLGWSYSALYGTTKGENPTDIELGHRIYTQSAFAEGSLRFRLTPQFQVGLIVQDYFGTDLTLSQRKDLVNNMLLGGGMVAFDLLKESGIFRIGGQLLAEVDDKQRKVLFYGATLQFGIPLRNYDTLLRRTDILIKQERTQKIEVPKVITRSVSREVTKYSLPTNSFKFLPSQSALNQDDQTFAADLGETLKLQSYNFKSVTIEASVQSTGDPKKDALLSELRANSIRNAIVSLGFLPANRIFARGLGSRPSTEGADSSNANTTLVELSFVGLSNPDALSNAFSLLLRKRVTPETCKGDRCK